MSYTLEIEPTGDVVEVEEGQTILDAALRQGVYLPHACNHGLCGTCKIELLEGEIDHGEASPFALMDMERDEGKCLACTSTLKEDCAIEADIDEDEDARTIPVKDFKGKVIEIKDLTPRIKGIVLELNEEIDFQAGQYVQFYMPGFEEPRAFSIATSPKDTKTIELNISLVNDGEVTPLIHQNCKIGDEFKITGPFGRFFVKESAQKPMMFFAGGSGLSSPKSMIEDLLQRGCDLPITLFHGARNEDELYYSSLFKKLEKEHENFRYIPVLSGDNLENWSGETGYLNDVAIKTYDNDFSNHKAYLCGPSAMLDSCITVLMRGRLYERDIHIEKFFSKADLSGDNQRSPLFKSL
ncbi:2Fe-2S iron-sulfur cluster binding domain-containing protein [Halarcobacter sp.]|uniref:NADH:ubiquinone reductase (Na(+)-transporting) subunit F n=1 Tax=Halarcobacter sp. TaxID=2321133 RepID=UPI002AAAFB02|nr:2Fe-2S iron-sulfur cluster binding domain-containing protein [Halarcobacter sp.]